MKKILVMLLALTLAFSMFSCGGDEQIEAFVAAIEETNPNTLTVTVKQESELGTLNAVYNTVYAEDGSFVMEYAYDVFNSAATSATEGVVSTKTGTVTCDKDGNYSDGGEFKGKNETSTGLTIDLEYKKFENYTISQDGTVLTAEISADISENVLGINLGVDSVLVITRAGNQVSTVSLVYTTEQGKVTILVSYN